MRIIAVVLPMRCRRGGADLNAQRQQVDTLEAEVQRLQALIGSARAQIVARRIDVLAIIRPAADDGAADAHRGGRERVAARTRRRAYRLRPYTSHSAAIARSDAPSSPSASKTLRAPW